jgi:hypothetical protein
MVAMNPASQGRRAQGEGEAGRWLPAKVSESLRDAMDRKGTKWGLDDFEELLKWLCASANLPRLLACTAREIQRFNLPGGSQDVAHTCFADFLLHFQRRGLHQAFFRKYDPRAGSSGQEDPTHPPSGARRRAIPRAVPDPVTSFSRYFLHKMGPLKSHARSWARRQIREMPPPPPECVGDDGEVPDLLAGLSDPRPNPGSVVLGRELVNILTNTLGAEPPANRLLWWLVMYFRFHYEEAVNLIEKSLDIDISPSGARVRVHRINSLVRDHLARAGYEQEPDTARGLKSKKKVTDSKDRGTKPTSSDGPAPRKKSKSSVSKRSPKRPGRRKKRPSK